MAERSLLVQCAEKNRPDSEWQEGMRGRSRTAGVGREGSGEEEEARLERV